MEQIVLLFCAENLFVVECELFLLIYTEYDFKLEIYIYMQKIFQLVLVDMCVEKMVVLYYYEDHWFSKFGKLREFNVSVH